MANIELPNTLLTMLNQLASKNTLKSWNIYENKYGKICFNIQFDIVCASEQSSMKDYTCDSKRISAKQQSRNANRILQITKKRKLSPTFTDEQSTSSTPEINRIETLDESQSNLDTPSHIQDCSPELLRMNTDVMEVCNIDSPEVPIKVEIFEKTQMEDLNVEYTSSLSVISETNTPDPSMANPEPSSISDADLNCCMLDCTEAVKLPPTPPPHHIVYTNDIINQECMVTKDSYDPEPFNSSQDFENTSDTSAPCTSESIIRCPCCDAVMDALHTCDSNGDTATDDLSSSNPQPPDCDSDLDSDDGQMNNDSDALNTSTQIQPIPSTQPDPDPPDTNWEAIFAVLSAHAEQIIQHSLSNLRRPTT